MIEIILLSDRFREEDLSSLEEKMAVEHSIDIKRYFRLLKRKIWLIISFVIVCAVGSALISLFLIQPTYQASTKLIVNKSEDATSLQQIDLNTVNANIKLIDTYKEIIKTPAIMDIVVAENPDFKLTSTQLINKVTVNSVNNTQVMTLSVTDNSHEKAVRIVNAISKVFQTEIPQIMKVDNVSLLNEAQFVQNPRPISTSITFNLIITIFLAFLLITTIIFIIDYFDDTLKNEEDVSKYLGLPTLSMIPRIREDDFKAKSGRSKKEIGEHVHVE
jgi:capsular polysaccharide biosynthesis protein